MASGTNMRRIEVPAALREVLGREAHRRELPVNTWTAIVLHDALAAMGAEVQPSPWGPVTAAPYALWEHYRLREQAAALVTTVPTVVPADV